MNLSDAISAISLVFAASALFINFFSYKDTQKLSLKALNRAHRPYVFSRTYAVISAGQVVPVIDVILFSVVNAPALVKKRKVSILKREANKEDILLHINPDDAQCYIYPLDNIQTTISINPQIFSHELAEKVEYRFIRIVEIDYTWIAKEAETYMFRSIDEYRPEFKNWLPISEHAN